MSTVINLNVGGCKYTTTRQTLTSVPDSMLSSMFSGHFDVSLDDNGCVFIDRDGQMFQHVLSYLRNRCVIVEEQTMSFLQLLRLEAHYFGLAEMESYLSEIIESRQQQLAEEKTEQLKRRKRANSAPVQVVVVDTAKAATSKVNRVELKSPQRSPSEVLFSEDVFEEDDF